MGLLGQVLLCLTLYWSSTKAQDGFCYPPPDVANTLPVSPPPNLSGNRYSLNAEIRFTCIPGYTNVGSPTAVCGNRVWNVQRSLGIPRCIRSVAPSPCTPGLCPANSQCNIVSGEARCICNSGYTQVGRTCQPTATVRPPAVVCPGGCGANRQCFSVQGNPYCICDPAFLDVRGVCTSRAMFSPSAGCPRPCVANSICGVLLSELVCACNPGYFLYRGACEPRPPPPAPRGCLRPAGAFLTILGIPANQLLISVGETIRFGCTDDRYVIQGAGVGLCLPGGGFSITVPTCVIRATLPPVVCPRPPFATNRYIVGPNGQQLTNKNTWAIGEVIRYSCFGNFVISGRRSARCLATGQFQYAPPQCVPAPTLPPVVCARPAPVANRFIVGPNGQQLTIKNSWAIGEVITFSCFGNYILSGSRTATCLSTGRFDLAAPGCILAPTLPSGTCIIPIAPRNGDFSPRRSQWNVGDQVTYSCNIGYQLTGIQVQTCQSDGTYEALPPTCEDVITPCTSPVIRFPLILQPPNNANDRITPGTVLRYSCASGFRLIGASTLTCQDNGEYTRAFPNCVSITGPPVVTPPPVAVFCANPPAQTNAFVVNIQASYNVGDAVTYACNSGFVLVGTGTSVCQSDGSFSALNIFCSATPQGCPRPTPPTNGYIEGRPTATSFAIGAQLTYRCNDLYIVQGPNVATCGNNLNFSPPPPICVGPPVIPVTRCSIPIGLAAGIVVVSSGPDYGVGEQIEYACTNGQTLSGSRTATCQPGGTFSSSPPACIGGAAARCSRPVTGPNVVIVDVNQQPTNDLFWQIGDIIRYACPPGYTLSGQAMARCLPNQAFMNPPPTCIGSAPGPVLPGGCARPSVPVNGRFVQSPRDRYNIGERVEFACNQGYVVQPGTSLVLVCGLNGFSPAQAVQCVVTGGSTGGGTGIPDNSIPEGCRANIPNGSQTLFPNTTDIYQFSCNAGYQIRNTGTQSDLAISLCSPNASGVFELTPPAPTCEPVS